MNLSTLGKHLPESPSESAAPDRERRIPPLERWNPPFCGDMDLLIKAGGEWWHEGRRMTRQGLIDLFASVIWREGDDYFLKTPVEKIGIRVEDVPFVIEDANVRHDADGAIYIECVTAHGDRVRLDDEHRLQLRPYQGQLLPYVRVRANLEARFARHAFYHLLEWCELSEEGDETVLRIPSGSDTQILRAKTAAF